MKNNYKFFIVLSLLLLFTLSCAYATNDNSTDVSDSVAPVKDVESNKVITKVNENTKDVKTSDETSEVSTYAALVTELTDNKDIKIINMKKATYKITKPVDIQGKSYTKTIVVNGNGATIDGSNSKTFLNIAANNKVTINDLIIKNTKGTTQAGAIVLSDKTNLVLNNCTFINDVSAGKGGAITNRGTTVINECTFSSNTADQGAAIWSTGEYGGSLEIKNSKFISNKASNTNNHDKTGVIYVVSDKNVKITSNTFEKNNGRLIHCFLTTTEISGNTFKNMELNAPKDTIRGGVIDNYESHTKIIDNTFNNITINSLALRGGVLYNEIGTSTFNDNKITNFKVKVTQNSDSLNGGIIFNRNSTLTVMDNTFSNTNTGYKVHGTALYNNIGTLNAYRNIFNTKTTALNDIRGAIYNDKVGNKKSILYYGGNNFNNLQNTGKVTQKILYNIGTAQEKTAPKTATTLTLNKVSASFGKMVTLKATLKDSNNKAITDGSVVFKVNGKTVTVKTNTDGVYSYKYKAIYIGTNNVTASFAANAKYKASSAKNTFNVVKGTSKITVNKITQKTVKKTITITGKLVGTSNAVLKSYQVTVKFNNRTLKVKTNANGVYTCKVTPTVIGTNNVTVSFAGNNIYKASTAKTTFKVVKAS